MQYRAEIRNLAHDLLLNRTNVGARVYKTRIVPLDDKKLPAILIYIMDDDKQRKGDNPPSFTTLLDLVIEVCAAQTGDGLDDALDEICEQVEDLLLCNPAFVGKFESIQSVSTKFHKDGSGQKPIFSAAISIRCQYQTEYPPVVGPEIAAVRVDVDVIDEATGAPDGNPEASLEVTLT